MTTTQDPSERPVPQTFAELLQAVQEHYEAHPFHRAGCRCLYPLARSIAQETAPRDGSSQWVHDTTRAGMTDLLVEIARRL